MAKRVNKQFVIILGASLLGVGVAGAGAIYYKRTRGLDPAVLKSQAAEAERTGDLDKAAAYYHRTAEELSKRREPGADEMYVKFADLSAKLSSTAKNSDEGIQHWQNTEAALRLALAENPRNVEVMQRLMESAYERAQMNRGLPAAWQPVEELVGRFVQAQEAKTSKPYEYRAEAMLESAKQVTSEVPESRLEAIEADLAKAKQLNPDSGKAVALHADLLAYRARRAERRSAMEDAATHWEAFEKETAEFLERHPDDPDVVTILASGLANRRRHAEAVEVLEKAYAKHPKSKLLGAALAHLYMAYDPGDETKTPVIPRKMPEPDKAEGIYKAMQAAEPESAEGYARLAMFYKDTGKAEEAIATYKQCLAHITAGGGLEAVRNGSWTIDAYDSIATLNLDVAFSKGVQSEAGKAAMAEASSYLEKLRQTHLRDKGLIYLLDGRIQFLKGNMPQAIQILTDAENSLSRTQGMAQRLMHTRLLLAAANQQLTPPQLGKSLEYLDGALEIQRSAGVMIQKAAILNALQRFEESEVLTKQVLEYANRMTPELVAQAQVQLARAQEGMGVKAGPESAMTELHKNWQQLPVAQQMQVAAMLLSQGDADGSLEISKSVIAKNAEKPSPMALKYAALAYLKLEQKSEAEKMLELALAKYPGNTEFEVLQGSLKNAVDTKEGQLALINSLSDPVLKQIQLSLYYRSAKDADKEIESLKAALAAVGEPTTPEASARYNEVIERLFNAASAAATGAAGAETKARYWKVLDEAVQQAEIRDIDGTKGKLFRGRLQLVKSGGREGLALVEQAVAARPDYAPGRSILAQAYYAQQPPRVEDALAEFRRALQLVPNDVTLVRSNLAMLLRQPTAKNMEEAKKLLATGLRLAPRDLGMLALNDQIGEPRDAIRARESYYKSEPGRLDNLHALVNLYMRNAKNDPLGVQRAIELVKPLAEKPSAELPHVALLAKLYVAAAEGGTDEQRKAGMEQGIKLFDPYLASGDEKVRFDGLIALGGFCSAKNVGQVDRAAAAFEAAIKIQPAGSDTAERYLGDLFFDINDMARAEEVYQRVLTKLQEGEMSRELVLRRVVEAQIRQAKYEQAEASLQKEIFGKKPPVFKDEAGKELPEQQQRERQQQWVAMSEAQGHVLRALMRIEQKRFAEAVTDLDAALAKQPGYSDALYFRAMANMFMEDGNLEQATSDLQTVKASADGQMGLNARIKLAQLLRKARRYVEAADEYAQILTIDPEHIEIRREYAAYLLSLAQAQQMLHVASVDQTASSLRLLNPSARLQELLRTSAEKYKEQVDWVLMQAQLQSIEGNNFDAQQFYRFLYSRLPTNPVVVNYYLESLLLGARQNRDSRVYEEVVRASTALLEKQPDLPFILFRRAEAHKAMGQEAAMNADIDRAFEVAALASIANKEYSPFRIALSQGTEMAPPSKDDTLAQRLRARLAAKPDETITALGLAHVLVAMNRGDEALQVLSKVTPPADDPALKAAYLKEAGLARYLGKDAEGAAKAYTEYLALKKDDIEAMNNFAFLLSESLGKPQEALPHAVRAVKLLESQADPATHVANRATFYDTLGWVKAQNKDWEGAAADLERSVKATPMPIALYHLAKVSVQLKKMTEASNAVDTGIKIARETNDPVLAQLEALNKEINP